MTSINLSIAGLIDSKEDANEIRFISKVFLTSIHIHELVENANKVKKLAEKLTKEVKEENKEVNK